MSQPLTAPASGVSRPQIIALLLLLLVSLFNYGDRFLLSILIPPIKAEFDLSDTQIGILTGIGFTFFYALMGVPIASIADKGSRRAVIGWALTAWSLMCAACGLVQNFWQLLVARVLLGVGEAGASPPSHALLADIFPAAKRATALGIYTLGSPLGLLIGFGIGGALAEVYGWRAVLFIFGVPGLVLAAAIFKFLPEPARPKPAATGAADVAKPAIWPSLAVLARIPTLWHATVASATSSMAWVSILLWAPTYFGRTFDMSLAEIGFRLSVVMSAGQAIALVLAGVIADRLGRADRRWYMWYGCGAVVVSAPFFVMIVTSGTPSLAQAALFAAFLFANMQTACSLAAVQFVAGPQRRALASACYLFLVNILSSLGPLAVGILSDAWSGELGTASLGQALMWVTLVACLWCGLHGWLGGRTLLADFKKAE